ncbi:GNAT family N-acetyltransferase [Mucilaginibacter sp.]
MKVVEVKDKAARRQFLALPSLIYQHDPNWIRPLDNDIEAVFDPQKNNFHEFGIITRWLLTDDNGAPAGRIAAFINKKKAYNNPQPTGGIGFFEVINDENAAFMLFNTAKEWLQQNGMQAMDGVINFGENDTFWGLLIEGFTPPSYGMNYHPPYYKKFFDDYGFVTQYEQISHLLDAHKPFPERFTKIANWVKDKPGYVFKHFSSKMIEQFASDFMEVYNDAWQNFENFVPINRNTILETFNKMKPLIDDQLIWFAYVNDEPAAFLLIMPDANQIFKHLNGKLDLLGKLKFLYYRWKGVNRMRAVVMGTKKKFQKHGLESVLFIKVKEYVLPLNRYNELELSWVGDFNEQMLSLQHAMEAKLGKKHATMRYLFA